MWYLVLTHAFVLLHFLQGRRTIFRKEKKVTPKKRTKKTVLDISSRDDHLY